ncbi:transposase [Plectonema radiosum]|uniref:transposase n=1 Tax=Plectonema radiosum TaxID=945768 RepID=UPI0035C8EEFD
MYLKNMLPWGKNSIDWYFGFKLHQIINDQGELICFLTPSNSRLTTCNSLIGSMDFRSVLLKLWFAQFSST